MNSCGYTKDGGHARILRALTPFRGGPKILPNPLTLLKSFYAATSAGTDVVNIHPDVDRSVREARVQEGLLTIGVRGWEAAVGICEYSEGGVARLKELMAEWLTVKSKEPIKGSAGRSYSVPGTLASLCFGTTLTVPINQGRLLMEPWLSVVLFDFASQGRRREYYVHILGDEAKKEKPAMPPDPGFV